MVYLQSMSRLIDDIGAFLDEGGFEYSFQSRHGFDVICVRTLDKRHTRVILPLEISAGSVEEAIQNSQEAEEAVRMISSLEGYPIIIPEDRWHIQRKMMQERILAHLELFSQAYARNCETRRIDKAEAKAFLAENHSYGYAACRYCYGLFLKRHTGHIAEEIRSLGYARDDRRDALDDKEETQSSDIGRLIAVATFSNARKWIKDGKEIRSYEWTRYASLPGLRVSGGMGKLLKAFIEEVQPDDIMSYADLEWSEGNVYKTLGFKTEMPKDPVIFEIDSSDWQRKALKQLPIGATPQDDISGNTTGRLFFINFGSRKFRLKLTDYR